MPDTILLHNLGTRRVPGWTTEKHHSEESFADHYVARMTEFELMPRRQLYNELERLRLQVENDGRLYIVAHHAQKLAAEDVYMKQWVRGWGTRNTGVREPEDREVVA